MAGLIKKQILKHLSKFAKNLSADKINLSTFRGEGELSNLELDCVALQNVMNLPTWLQFNHAKCNKVHVKIPWTKLKTTPISIFLDSVEVDMITCEKPRAPNGPSPIQASASSGDTSYGFTEKVLEGMSVTINSISINFTSAAFNANFQLSQLYVLSTNPKWEKTDLRSSRIQDKTSGQVLTFKKIVWQTMRIVANAESSGDKNVTTPLRLITNQSEIRMTFRRKMSDCSVLASRLQIHFDDLLWVLTDSQVQSALLCVKSLRDTIERSSQQMRELGLVKSHETHQEPSPRPNVINDDSTDDHYSSKLFQNHTVFETSFHIDLDRVDLHICEESSPMHKASKRAGTQGGAIQISLHSLKIDNYPYHKPASDRRHFRDYDETMTERDSWAESIIKQFRHDFADLKKAADHAGNIPKVDPNVKPARLAENCLIVRLTDIDIHQVTTSNSKKQISGKLINSTRKELHLPDEMPLFHFIRTEYYYPDGRDFPAPHDNIYMQINAPQLHAHWDSLIWLNRLSTVTVQAVQKMLEDLGILSDAEEDDPTTDASTSPPKDEEHTDIRIQILMPKIFVPGPTSMHDKQPHGLEIQVSKAAVTNCRQGTDCTRSHLKNVLHSIEKQYLAKKPESFPSDEEIDLSHCQELLKSHAKGNDNPLNITLRSGNPTLTRSALIASATKDIWSVDLDNIWIDFVMPSENKQMTPDEPTGGFLGLSKGMNDPVKTGIRAAFIDSFPAQLWIAKSFSAGTAKLEIPVILPEKGQILSPANSIYNITSQEVKPEGFDVPVDYSPSPLKTSTSGSSLDKGECKVASPRSLRNRKLLDYYRTSKMEDQLKELKHDGVAHDQVSLSSTPSTKNKVISTHILLQTDKSLRLQLDHHQYLYLLRLIDKIEEVGKQLEDSSKEALSSTPSSASSTPSITSKSRGDVLNRASRKKSKPVSTTSVRIAAPSADLILILRPPPPNVRTDNEKSDSESVTSNKIQKQEMSDNISSRDSSVKSEEISQVENLKSPTDKLSMKFTVQDTPPLSECSSDTTSIQGSDNLSIFGESFTSQGGVYPHVECGSSVQQHSTSYPHEISDNEDIPVLSQDSSSNATVSSDLSRDTPYVKDLKVNNLSKEKSGSLTVLPSTPTSRISRDILRNHSSENLRSALTTTTEQKNKITEVSTSKSSSSGYESGSYDSIPPPANLIDAKRRASSHSHSSSDASDQFVIVQVDEKGKGKGIDEFPTVKLVRKTASVSSGHVSETSSLSNQSLASSEQGLTKSDLNEDSLVASEMADSQITVRNADAGSICSSSTSDKGSQTRSEEEEIKKESEPEMSSQALIHVSDGVELAVDSNDTGDSVVKIVASLVHVLELGIRKSEKNDTLFTDYSAKKCESLVKKLDDGRIKMPDIPNVCLRIDSGPLAGRFSPIAVKDGHIQISANQVPLSLKSSTLANLGAFLEDETPPKIVPMKIEAADVKLTITDDMPPAYEVTPQPDPITLHVHSATVRRTDDGTFHVTTSTTGGKILSDGILPERQPPTTRQYASDNFHMAQNLPESDNTSIVEPKESRGAEHQKSEVKTDCDLKSDNASRNMNENNSNTEQLESENKRLQDVISDLNKKLQEVETERDFLTEALKLMQEDLITSERERSSLRARINS